VAAGVSIGEQAAALGGNVSASRGQWQVFNCQLWLAQIARRGLPDGPSLPK